LFHSEDCGESWSLITVQDRNKELPILPQKWKDITSDALGENLVAISVVDSQVTKESGIYYSNNRGKTWKQSNVFTSPTDWKSVVSDQSGQYVVTASSNNGIYTSLDFGITWTKAKFLNEVDAGQVKEIASMGWEELAVDFTGQYVVVIASNSNRIYHSTDHGLVWDLLEIPMLSSPSVSLSEDYYFNSIISDFSGQYLTVCSSDSLLFQSNNYGEDWELCGNPSSESCSSLAYDTAGTSFFLLTDVEETILISNDHGLSWMARVGRVVAKTPDFFNAVIEDGSSKEQLGTTEFSALFSGYKGYRPRIKKGKNQTKQNSSPTVSVQHIEKRGSYEFNSLFESYNDNCKFLLVIGVFVLLCSILTVRFSIFELESKLFSQLLPEWKLRSLWNAIRVPIWNPK
jgi:hypothetical protein